MILKYKIIVNQCFYLTATNTAHRAPDSRDESRWLSVKSMESTRTSTRTLTKNDDGTKNTSVSIYGVCGMRNHFKIQFLLVLKSSLGQNQQLGA